jgi:hypothetical protein
MVTAVLKCTAANPDEVRKMAALRNSTTPLRGLLRLLRFWVAKLLRHCCAYCFMGVARLLRAVALFWFWTVARLLRRG